MTAGNWETRPVAPPETQVRRAWLVLGVAFLAFVALIGVGVSALTWAYRHATEPESARLEIISGASVHVRSTADIAWRLASGGTTIREGDRVSTALGTVIRLKMFDGSTVEVAEDTVVEIQRVRSSRFLDRTKLIVLEPERGTIYLQMAPRGEYGFSEMTVRVRGVAITMSDEPGRAEAGSFLVEVLEQPGRPDADERSIRTAVLRGAATIRTPSAEQRLEANQQAIVRDDGSIAGPAEIRRELLVNGAFTHGLAGWIEIRRSQGGEGRDPAGSSIELLQDRTTQGDAVAVEFLRAGSYRDIVVTGIRQRIGKTVRVPSSLLLKFEARISDQQPAGDSDHTEFPLVLTLNYIDVEGQEREWSHGYYVLEDPARPVPRERATPIDRDRWQLVVFDLGQLAPAPRHITSIVVYASGRNYQTRVANLSLTSSELVEADR